MARRGEKHAQSFLCNAETQVMLDAIHAHGLVLARPLTVIRNVS